MPDTNPKDMLTLYRQNSNPFMLEQLAQFQQLTVHDRLEMLFLMIAHTNAGLQHVHSLIRPEEVETVNMPTPEKAN